MAIESAADLKVIISGGARGLGGAAARLLAAEGAQVMLGDLLDEDGEKLAAELGDKVQYQHLDVTKTDDWEAIVARAEKEFGGVNALFNNAGIGPVGGVVDADPAVFRKLMDVNANGVFYGMHYTAPAIIRAGGGAIVNTSSTAGLMGYFGIVGYVASKWAVRGMTKAAALDLARDGVRVCSIHPGVIDTDMGQGVRDEMMAATPMPRKGKPEEVAKLVRFLLVDATYSTGSEIAIDGGTTIGQLTEVK